MAPGILLAGGRSLRMGRNKALEKLGTLSLVSRVLQVLHELCSPVILVTNTPEEYGDCDAVVLSDEKPYLGPLGGLLTGMRYAQVAPGMNNVNDLAMDETRQGV
ncbi:MAG: nucleotidyltransferase family protein, partial [Armatimonadetes bacterium]|nr:nucleotidyltransferase family protein [Armatimonadota bacterium]